MSLMRSLALVCFLAVPTLADEIHLVDGSIIADCTVASETLAVVSYKGSKPKEEVASDTVLRVVFSAKPPLVESADAAASDDQLGAAIDDFKEYISGVIGAPQKKFEWAPAYAMYRLLELSAVVGDSAGAADALEKLRANAPDSRYLPYAYLRQAQLLTDLNKGSEALKALEALGQLIEEKSLSERWALELKLAQVLSDSKLLGEGRRSKLSTIASSAKGKFGVVHNRAQVAIGESYLSGENKDHTKAMPVFQAVVDDPQADDATLAGAFTGLGECMFQVADKSNSAEDWKKALLAFLRVGIVYKDQLAYAPKAIFYAGLIYERLGTPEALDRAQALFLSLRRDYPTTQWAADSRGRKRS